MIKRTLLTVITVMLMLPLAAGVGTTSMDILKVPSGVKSQAMGGAYIAAADDTEALDYNPAGLARMEKTQMSFIHDAYLQGVFFDSIYYAGKMGDAGKIGVVVKYLNAGEITSTLETREGNYAGEGGNVSGFNYLAGIAYATGLKSLFFNDFSKNVDIGLSLKVTGESIGTGYSNNGLSADIGGVYNIVSEEQDFMTNRGKTIWNRSGFGLAFRNLGTSFNAAITPVNMAFGAFTQALNLFVPDNRVRMSADLDYNLDAGFNIKTGLEYMQRVEIYSVAARVGGSFGTAERSFSGLTLGGGAGLKTENFSLNIDYVFLPFGVLGDSHKIGLSVSF